MSKKKFIMPVLIKAGDSRMKKGFGEKVADYDCHIVEAGNLNNFICERDRLHAERDELLSALEEITADYKEMLAFDYCRVSNHITEKCDKLIERVKECK